MNKVSILLSIRNTEKLKKTLDSITNQTLKDMEILLISHRKAPIKNNKINVYSSVDQAIQDANSEYIFFMNETDFLRNNACELLYEQAKNDNLELLYVPIIDQNIKQNKLNKINDNRQTISPFNFTQFCKKEYILNLNLNTNLFYEIHENSKITDFTNNELCFRCDISENTIKKYIDEFLNRFPNKQDIIFNIIFEYLINYPLDIKLRIYDIIKFYFKSETLNKKNQEIFNLLLKNNNLIDFLTEYQLDILEYELYKNPLETNHNYKISVVIPIFNNETLIHRTLMSLENQSFGIENIEVLMINDASTDNTRNVINRYVDKYPNFKAAHIKNGTGSSGTPRNVGLTLACGEYVIFLDHDDFFEINALEKLYNKITEYNCDFVYGTYVLINSEESIKFSYPHEKHGFFKNIEDNNESIIIPPSIWTKLFKKEFLLKNNILFPTILGEDSIFLAKSLKNANGIYYLWDEVICYYNLNENSYSNTLSYDYFIEGFVSEDYLYNLFNNWGKIEYYKIRGQGILDFYMNRILYCDLSDDEIKNIFPLLYKFCDRLNKLNVTPKLDKNKIAFDNIINNDLKSFLKFKKYKPSKIKTFSNKILNKINKHGLW